MDVNCSYNFDCSVDYFKVVFQVSNLSLLPITQLSLNQKFRSYLLRNLEGCPKIGKSISLMEDRMFNPFLATFFARVLSSTE